MRKLDEDRIGTQVLSVSRVEKHLTNPTESSSNDFQNFWKSIFQIVNSIFLKISENLQENMIFSEISNSIGFFSVYP